MASDYHGVLGGGALKSLLTDTAYAFTCRPPATVHSFLMVEYCASTQQPLARLCPISPPPPFSPHPPASHTVLVRSPAPLRSNSYMFQMHASPSLPLAFT